MTTEARRQAALKNIEVEIVADSVNPDGKRIVSSLWTYPRFIHAEIMTHRDLSRNAASSRAIPVSKVISATQENPAVPEWWGKAQKGMQANERFEPGSLEEAHLIEAWECLRDVSIGGYTAIPTEKWNELREEAQQVHALNMSEREWEELDALSRDVWGAQGMMEHGLHKQIANRVLEPWFRIAVLVTATEWDNFFGLRAHPAAQPEFQVLAYRMLDQFVKHESARIGWGDWHIPFDPDPAGNWALEDRLTVSVAKAARTSYVAFDADKTLEEQRGLYTGMRQAGHWSPFEHPAQADEAADISGNFRGGWKQLRHTFPDQVRKVASYEDLLAEKPDWITL